MATPRPAQWQRASRVFHLHTSGFEPRTSFQALGPLTEFTPFYFFQFCDITAVAIVIR